MASVALLEQAKQEAWTDEKIVEHVLAGDTVLYELLMRRYNQRLYRVARSILREDDEAEDVMQDAYVRAYQNLSSFAGRAKFATWLTRIALNEALARSRKRSRFQPLDIPQDSNGSGMETTASADRSPEQEAYGRELAEMLEHAVLSLSEEHRVVLLLRDVEGMSTDETASCLDLSPENVKVRLHRARAGVRKQLYKAVGATTAHCFQFQAVRCDRVVEQVFRALGLPFGIGNS